MMSVKTLCVAMCLTAAVSLGAGHDALSGTLLFGFDLPTQNLNGYPKADYPERSNLGAPWSALPEPPTQPYKIAGDTFVIGSPGQQYHIEQITLWMVFGLYETYDNTTWNRVSQYGNGFIPQNGIRSLALWFGPDGGAIVKSDASWTSQRIWYSNGENYHRMGDGYWAGMQKITFTTDLTVNGGQQYDYFLDGVIDNSITIPNTWHVPSLHAAYQPTSGITPVGGSLDNKYYWYEVGTGVISLATASLPQDRIGDANVAVYGNMVPLPSALLLLGAGLARMAGFARKFRK